MASYTAAGHEFTSKRTVTHAILVDWADGRGEHVLSSHGREDLAAKARKTLMTEFREGMKFEVPASSRVVPVEPVA